MANPTLDLGSAFGWTSNLGVWVLGLALLGAALFLVWYVWTKHMNFKYTVFVEETRGSTATPHMTWGRFEKLKDGKIVFVLKSDMSRNIGSITYENILPGNKIRLLRMNDDTYVPLDFRIENEKPVHRLIEDEQMRFAYAGTIEKIWLMTQKEGFFTQFGHIIWLIIAAVLLVVIMYPVLDSAGKASAAYASAADNLRIASENLVNAMGAASEDSPPPVPFVIAPEVSYGPEP